MARILVEDIGFANLPGLTKLKLNANYMSSFQINNVIKYLASGSALKLKVLDLSSLYMCVASYYLGLLQPVQNLALQELHISSSLFY